VRLHALSPSRLAGDIYDRHARCGPAARASRFLTGWETRFATHDSILAGRSIKTQSQTTTPKSGQAEAGQAEAGLVVSLLRKAPTALADAHARADSSRSVR